MKIEQKACANNYKMDRYSKNYFNNLENCLSGINSICHALKYTALNEDDSLVVPDVFHLLELITAELTTELDNHLEHTTVIE